jgi:hypothetical protein
MTTKKMNQLAWWNIPQEYNNVVELAKKNGFNKSNQLPSE